MGVLHGIVLYSKLKTLLYTRLISPHFKRFGGGSRVSPPFRFHGLAEMAIGDHVCINPGCWIHVIGYEPERAEARIVIESRAGIGMGATISAAESVVIEEYALLARNVYISDHSHAFEDINCPISMQGIDKVAPVRIGRSSWLGQNVVVLPGVSIGQHCVIGANSVVRSSIPDFSVAVGAPARVVKRYNRATASWESVNTRAQAA